MIIVCEHWTKWYSNPLTFLLEPCVEILCLEILHSIRKITLQNHTKHSPWNRFVFKYMILAQMKKKKITGTPPNVLSICFSIRVFVCIGVNWYDDVRPYVDIQILTLGVLLIELMTKQNHNTLNLHQYFHIGYRHMCRYKQVVVHSGVSLIRSLSSPTKKWFWKRLCLKIWKARPSFI